MACATLQGRGERKNGKKDLLAGMKKLRPGVSSGVSISVCLRIFNINVKNFCFFEVIHIDVIKVGYWNDF